MKSIGTFLFSEAVSGSKQEHTVFETAMAIICTDIFQQLCSTMFLYRCIRLLIIPVVIRDIRD